MKKIFYIVWISIGLICLSCGSLQLIPTTPSDYSGITLGMIGERNGLLESGFEIKAQPSKTGKWAVRLTQKPFAKSEFKRFLNKKGQQVSSLEYVDSLAQKPTYLVAELVDDFKFAQALNTDSNRHVYAFAKANKDLRTVTSISFQVDQLSLNNEAKWYLESSQDGALILNGYVAGKKTQTIDFATAIVFDYELSFFCWGLDKRGKQQIFDVVKEGKSCSKPFRRNAEKLIKEKNIYTF